MLQSFWRLRGFLRPYRPHMIAVIIATIGVSGLNLIGPWILRESFICCGSRRVKAGPSPPGPTPAS